MVSPKRTCRLACLWLALILGAVAGELGLVVVRGESPLNSVLAVANRDAEGAVVVDADEARNYQPTATDCRSQCLNTTDCNVWVWCGTVSGCASAGSYTRDITRYQQCWLKSDRPPRGVGSGSGKFPRSKNTPDQTTGWMSGTTLANFTDAAPFPEKTYSCYCQRNYTYGGYRFIGVCARIEEYSSSCLVENTCRDAPSNGVQGCLAMEPCTVLLDTDLQEDQILISGDHNGADSAEDCCYQCSTTRMCTAWTWCSDSAGCGGERFRFRQCWLKTGDPTNPKPKKGFGGSPGWISGVRLAWLPA